MIMAYTIPMVNINAGKMQVNIPVPWSIWDIFLPPRNLPKKSHNQAARWAPCRARWWKSSPSREASGFSLSFQGSKKWEPILERHQTMEIYGNLEEFLENHSGLFGQYNDPCSFSCWVLFSPFFVWWSWEFARAPPPNPLQKIRPC